MGCGISVDVLEYDEKTNLPRPYPIKELKKGYKQDLVQRRANKNKSNNSFKMDTNENR